jgi:AraC family transcriptional activator of tynA and feaB
VQQVLRSHGENRLQPLGTLRIAPAQIPYSGRILRELEPLPLRHLKELRIVQSANPNGFLLTVSGFHIGRVLAAVQRSGAVTAASGRPGDDDPIVIHAVTSGWIKFESANEVHTVRTGQLIVRDAGNSWRLASSPNTASHVITVPRALFRKPFSRDLLKRAHLADMGGPEARLVLDYLKMLETAEWLDSPVAADLAETAFMAFIAGLIENDPLYHWLDAEGTMMAARGVIERHLQDEDLSPALIAHRLGISVRTLHRSFSYGDQSVMSLIRQLRIERARADLLSGESESVVSQIAAKWHFSDASHFIRIFKARYGVTPGVYVHDHVDARS